MSGTKPTPESEEVVLTPEQLKQKREDLKSFFTSQLDFLKTQLEYETLLTNIEEQRAKRAIMAMKQAEIWHNQNAPDPEPEPDSQTPPITRPLKKD